MARSPRRPRPIAKAGPSPDAPVKGPVIAPAIDPRQHGLFDDPMPARVEPCLALLAAKPPSSGAWAFEVKWDGYRLAVHIEPAGAVRIITRGGHDWTNRFPTIAASAAALGLRSAIMDGEAVVLDVQGRSDFAALQRALGGRGGKGVAKAAVLYAFDLLYIDGQDIRAMSLEERRALLESAIEGSDPGVRLSEEIDADGAAFLRQACALGLEGIIAKRRDAPYRSGRGGEWLKIKCVQSDTFLVIGYEPSSAALGGIGGLFLAAQRKDGLEYVGNVGTGFTASTGTALRRRLNALATDSPPIPIKAKGALWTSPTVAVEIEFRGWTGDGKLRHASFKGAREDADA